MADFDEKVRAAFDAEFKRAPVQPNLRRRVISKAIATPRGSLWAAWFTAPRLAGIGVAAAVLIVAAVAIRAATQQAPAVAQHSPPPAPALAFGKVPPAQLRPPQGLGAGGGSTSTVQPYFGPASLTWSAALPMVPARAPVYRFAFPSRADADAFAARLGAVLVSSDQTSETYRGPDGDTLTIGPDPVSQEYVFDINSRNSASGSQPLSDAAATAAADRDLARFGLTPSWPFNVEVSSFTPTGTTTPLYMVEYQRVINLPGGITADEIDSRGDPIGIQVTVDSSGAALRIGGVLRLAESSAVYPLRAGSDALKDALKPGRSRPGSGPVPRVKLTRASLVYIVTEQDNVGYMEPAYFFTGTFVQSGSTMEMRVLVPAVSAAALSS